MFLNLGGQVSNSEVYSHRIWLDSKKDHGFY